MAAAAGAARRVFGRSRPQGWRVRLLSPIFPDHVPRSFFLKRTSIRQGGFAEL
jgi:hypothetical protein